MRHVFDRRVVAWCGAATVMSLALGGALYATFERLSHQAGWVAHTQEVLLELRALVALIDEATGGVRGFALTGEDRYMVPHSHSLSQISQRLRRLGTLTVDNASQQQQLRELTPLVTARVRSIEAMMALRRARGIEAVIAYLRSGDTERLMDRIHDIISAMEAEEGRLLDLRMRSTTEATRRTVAVFIAGLATNVLLLALAFGHLGRQMSFRDRAEETLHRSEKRFRGIFDAAAVGMAVIGPDRRWLEVNPSFCETVGYERAELLAGDSESITHPDDLGLEQRAAGPLLAHEVESYRLEKRYLHRTGRTVDALLSVSMVRDEAGRPLHFVAMIKDITERKRAEARLAAQHAAAEILATSATLEEAAPRLLEAISKALGLAVGEFWQPEPATGWLRPAGRWWSCPDLERDFGPSQGGGPFRAGEGLPGRAWAEGRPLVIEDVTKDPAFARAEAARSVGLHGALATPIFGASATIGVLTFFGRDVAADDDALRAALEMLGRQIGLFADRRYLEEASRASDRRLRAVFDQTLQFIGLLDPRGMVLDANRSALEFVGLGREDVVGRPFWEAPWWSHSVASVDRIRSAIAAAASGEMVRFETEHTSHDGRTITVDFTLKPVKDESGRVIMLLPEGHDITERRRAEEAQREAREAAEAASRLKGEFLANVSHEIRTPMNAILGMTELTLGTALSQEQRENLEIVQSATDSLLSLVDDLLDFSKMEAGKLQLDPVVFRLRDTLGDTLDMLALRAHLKGLELSCRVAPNVPDLLVGDPARLRQILANLVGNAIKFTESGDVVVGVELGGMEPRDGVEIHFRVTDSGIGIPPAQQERIFAPFTQADGSTTRVYGGTGLGLAICAQLVGLMGGRIRVESEVGRGSTFHFTVRLEPADECRRPEPADVNDLHGRDILVVDDNPVNRRILGEMLTHWGALPTLTDGAAAALMALDRRRAEGSAFSLVLLDVQMPGTDGFALAERLKADPGHGGVIILMLSSTDRQSVAARCEALSIAAYLHKPIREAELRSAILRALGSAPPAPVPSPSPAPVAPSMAARPLRILLAEDHPFNQKVAVLMLAKHGHKVTVAGDGREALEALGRQAFDVVLMDVQMPGRDGLQATGAIRSSEAATGRHVPIIALTAHARQEDRDRCRAAGMDDYISKPLKESSLLESIDRHVFKADPRPDSGHSSSGDDPMKVQDALARVDGDRHFLGEMAALFLAEGPGLADAIRQSLAEADLSRVGHPAHSLKNWLGNFAAGAAFEAARRLEDAAGDGRLEEASTAFADLERELERLGRSLTRLAPASALAEEAPVIMRTPVDTEAHSCTR
jgi:PAS domain S-box-containing protein